MYPYKVNIACVETDHAFFGATLARRSYATKRLKCEERPLRNGRLYRER
jgi:hypothetical protein